MQLQKQIEMQKAAAAQIQKQIEEQQRQAMLEQRSNSNPAMQLQNVQRFSQEVNSQQPGHMQVKQPSRNSLSGSSHSRRIHRDDINSNNMSNELQNSNGNNNLNMMHGTSRVNVNSLNEEIINLDFNRANIAAPPDNFNAGVNIPGQKRHVRHQHTQGVDRGDNTQIAGLNFGAATASSNKSNMASGKNEENGQSSKFKSSSNVNLATTFNTSDFGSFKGNVARAMEQPGTNIELKGNGDNSNASFQPPSSGFHNPYNTQTVGGMGSSDSSLPYSANAEVFTPQMGSNDQQTLWSMMQGVGSKPRFDMQGPTMPQMNATAKEFVPNVAATEFVPSGFSMANDSTNGAFVQNSFEAGQTSSLMKPQNGSISNQSNPTGNGWKSNDNVYGYAQW